MHLAQLELDYTLIMEFRARLVTVELQMDDAHQSTVDSQRTTTVESQHHKSKARFAGTQPLQGLSPVTR
jgi:hypothetical protein